MALIFRRMKEEDLDKVYELEVLSFTDPWLREFFEMGLHYDAFIALSDEELAGYICTMQVLDECTITNICVKQELRRHGIARYLMDNTIQTMDERGVRYYYLEVRISNRAAVNLYNHLGFRQVGLRKEYYHNPVEDAMVMAMERNNGIERQDERL